MTPTVKCRVFGGSQGRGVLVMSWFGMLVVFGAVSLGLPPLVSMMLFFVALGLGIRRLAGTATYSLSSGIITRHYRSFSGHNERSETRALRDLTSWKLDHELSRGFQRYEFFELDAEMGQRWIITSRQDAAGFVGFKSALVAELEQMADSARGEEAHAGDPHRPAVPVPRQRPSFYRTWYGRAFALLLLLLSLGLAAAAIAGLVGASGLFKLGIFIVPGAVYLLWRSFGPQP